MNNSAKLDTLEELKHTKLTKVKGRKPNHEDVETWEEECAIGATKIKTTYHPEGKTLGHLADVISEDEYRLEIMDDDWEYEIQEEPGAYNPDITGDEDEYVIKRMEAEHKEAQRNFMKSEGVQEHFRRQFEECMDSTWIAALRRPRGGFANITIKTFLTHLRDNVAKLKTKEKKELRKRIEFEWDQTQDIKEYFQRMIEQRTKLESWGIIITDEDMVETAVTQMQDSGLYDRKFLRQWEQKEDGAKTWAAMMDYYREEYDAIKQFDDPTAQQFESINQLAETPHMSEFMEDLMQTSTTNNEQIQQMAAAFQGTAATMSEVMDRLKAVMDENKSLVKSVATLTETNKQLVETIKIMGGKANTEQPKGIGGPREYGICTHCSKLHRKPFDDHCHTLEKNKHLKEAYDKRRAEKAASKKN